MPRDLAAVQADLERLGVPPDAAARMAAADVSGKSPQLVREALLHGVWASCVDPAGAWIDSSKEQFPVGEALTALLAAGADRAHLTRLVRGMQFELIAAFLCLLDEGGHHLTPARWRIYEVDDAGQPARPVLALHESLTASDPTGESDGWM